MLVFFPLVSETTSFRLFFLGFLVAFLSVEPLPEEMGGRCISISFLPPDMLFFTIPPERNMHLGFVSARPSPVLRGRISESAAAQ